MDIQPTDPRSPATKRTADMRTVAIELEAAFLSEMFKAAKIGEPLSGIASGGIGEDQFASFLRNEYARAVASSGQIGIAEMVVRAIQARTGTGD